MIGRKEFLRTLNSVYPFTIGLPNGAEVIAVQAGSVPLPPKFKIYNVLCIMNLDFNLISLV